MRCNVLLHIKVLCIAKFLECISELHYDFLPNTILPARQRAGNASLPVVAYASPDVLRAEMFNSSTQTIRDAVEPDPRAGGLIPSTKGTL